MSIFAIIRARYGRTISQNDSQFESSYQGCKDNGIPCGVYWYSYAVTVSDIQTEAKVFLEVIKDKTFEYPVYLDIEVALISLLGTLGGSFGGIVVSSKMTNFRLQQLENKVAEHNNYAKRVPIFEKQMKVANHRIDDLEHKA